MRMGKIKSEIKTGKQRGVRRREGRGQQKNEEEWWN
jgi:hypothetical protein